MVNDYWLVSTEHLESGLWFRDDGDFKSGMNYVALLAATEPVEILAFVLMSNHVHFVIRGSNKDISVFIRRFKKLYSQYYSKKYSVKQLLRHNKLDLKRLITSDESFERAVAYVQMNPVSANICIHPSGYPWGTGKTFFSQTHSKGRSIGNLSVKERRAMLHSKRTPPLTYIVDEEGFINPSSYVNAELVESVFKTAKRMSYFLNTSSKAKRNPGLPSFSDKLISLALNELCVSVFNKTSIADLENNQIEQIIKQIHFKFSADPYQIARTAGIPYSAIAKMLDSI